MEVRPTESCDKIPGRIPAASCRPESQNVRHSFSPGNCFCQCQSLCSLRGISNQNSLDMALFRSPDNLCQCCQSLMDLLKLLCLTDCRIYFGLLGPLHFVSDLNMRGQYKAPPVSPAVPLPDSTPWSASGSGLLDPSDWTTLST